MPRDSQGKTLQSIYLTAEQLEWLRGERERTGASIAEIMRRALDAYRGASEKPTSGS